MKNGSDKLSDSPDMLYRECIEITEEQMHGLKGEETVHAEENTFSRWPSNFPSAIHVSQDSNKLGRRGIG